MSGQGPGSKIYVTSHYSDNSMRLYSSGTKKTINQDDRKIIRLPSKKSLHALKTVKKSLFAEKACQCPKKSQPAIKDFSNLYTHTLCKADAFYVC